MADVGSGGLGSPSLSIDNDVCFQASDAEVRRQIGRQVGTRLRYTVGTHATEANR